MPFDPTSMMLNKNGSVYHLSALPQDIAPTIILVGDPNRAKLVSNHFDDIHLTKTHREFILQTGTLNHKPISVIGTGIGAGNIDIVMNELDMLANVDLVKKIAKPTHTPLTIIRLGTSGSLQQDITVGSTLLSSHAFGFDGLLNYYDHTYNIENQTLFNHLKRHFDSLPMISNLYLGQADRTLLEQFKSLGKTGITFTSGGFYGPQHRQLRAPIIKQNIFDIAHQFKPTITNLEMETAAIYSLGQLLGHRCLSINAIVANRINGKIYKNIPALIEQMIENTIDLL